MAQALGRRMVWWLLAPVVLASAIFFLHGGLSHLVGHAIHDTKAASRAEQHTTAGGQAGLGTPRHGPQGSTRGAPRRSAPDANLPTTARAEDFISTLAATALDLLRWVLRVTLAGSLAVIASRAFFRRRRRMVRYRLEINRLDRVRPVQVQGLFETIHRDLLRRWWVRLPQGQPPLVFEISVVVGRDPEDDVARGRIVFTLCMPEDPDLEKALLAALRTRYRNLSLSRTSGRAPEWCRHVVRLKKRHPFAPRTLKVPDDRAWSEGGMPIAEVIAALEALDESLTLQVVVQPTPAFFERAARSLIRWTEERLERERRDRATAGTSSRVAKAELEAAGEGIAWHGLFFTDIRVGARRRRAAQLVANKLIATTRGENQLRARDMIARRRVCADRMRRGLANPLPSWRRGVLSSMELASIWHLPGVGGAHASLERSYKLRLAPPAAVRRAKPALALAHHDGEAIALRPEDYYLNHLIVGIQGSGKTSELLRQFELLANDYSRTVIFLDAMGGGAKRAIGVVPEDRRVTYLNTQNPEVGIDLWDIPGASESEVMDAQIYGLSELTRTEAGESQVYTSSERFLAYAGIAAQVAYPKPTTYFHLRRLMGISEVAVDERGRIAKLYGDDPRYAAVCEHLLEWNEQIRKAPSHMVARMDAPANKVAKLTVPAVDTILRHPVPIDIDRIVREREVLIVEGNVRFAPDITRTLMLLVLGRIDRALLAQLDLPEDERVRTHLLIDEGQYVFSRLIPKMASTNRAAGQEMTLATQYLAQMEDRKVRDGVLALFRHWSIFQVGLEDARLFADRFQVVWEDSIRGSAETASANDVTPTTLTSQPAHNFSAKWEVGGATHDPFTAETYAMRGDPERATFHLEAQRARGAHPVDAPPPPPQLGVVAEKEEPEDPAERAEPEGEAVESTPKTTSPKHSIQVDAGRGGQATLRLGQIPNGSAPSPGPRRGTGEGENGTGADERTGHARSGRRAGEPATPAEGGSSAPARRPVEVAEAPDGRDVAAAAELGSLTSAGLSDLFLELSRYTNTSRLVWGQQPRPPKPAPELREVDLEVVGAVWEFRALSTPMIHRRFFAGRGASTMRERLKRLWQAGYVTRCKVTTGGSGADPWIYLPTKAGFELCRRSDVARVRIPEAAIFRERDLSNYQFLVHDLRVAAWVFALEVLLVKGSVVRGGVHGPLLARVSVPESYDRAARERRRPALAELPGMGSAGARILDLALEPPAWGVLKPDAAIELEIDGRRLDLLVEYEHRSKMRSLREKLLNYDAFLTAWWRAHERYRELGQPPIVIFVVSDEKRVGELLRLADTLLIGGVTSRPGAGDREVVRLGRQRTFVCVERDVHQRTTRACRLVQDTPKARRRQGRNRAGVNSAASDLAEQVSFLPRRVLRGPAT